MQLIQGDCLEVMQDIPANSVDLVLTDPPYGTTACKWDSVIPFEPMWEQLKRITKKRAAIVLFGGQPFTSALIMSNVKMFKYCWVWEKEKGSGIGNSRKMPLKKHEDVLVFYSKQPFYDYKGEPLEKPYTRVLPKSDSKTGGLYRANTMGKSDRTYKTYTHRTKHSVLKIARDDNRKGLHPTQKPVALMEYLIKTYTNPGETVLDFTMGSGTTGVACVNLGRKFIGIELDPDYFKIAQERIAAVQPRLI